MNLRFEIQCFLYIGWSLSLYLVKKTFAVVGGLSRGRGLSLFGCHEKCVGLIQIVRNAIDPF